MERILGTFKAVLSIQSCFSEENSLEENDSKVTPVCDCNGHKMCEGAEGLYNPQYPKQR